MSTRDKERRIISIACLSVIVAVLAFGLSGCGTLREATVETKTVMSYEAIGATLQVALPTLQELCAAELINTEDCLKAKKVYNEAVAIYKFLGESAVRVVDTSDDSSYQVMALKLVALLTELQAYESN